MRTVVLVTGHYWGSWRRAGFHWLADAFHRLGWRVVFFTSTLSWISYMRRDHRTRYPEVWRSRNHLVEVKAGLYSYVWFTPFHPANLRSDLLNRWSAPLFRTYGRLPLGEVESLFREADLLVFESTPGLLLLKRVLMLNPRARYVYRVSDDLRLLRNHPVVLEAEEEALPYFHMVSVPSAHLFERFSSRHPNVHLHYHGIRKEIFDQPYPNPFAERPGPHLVFVGVSHFDEDFLARASRLFPQASFHIIGPIPQNVRAPNVVYYGELPFSETIPYIVHADVGLATWSYAPGAESLSDSLKIIQYTYAGLPILAPDFLPTERLNVVKYKPGHDESIREAVNKALALDRSRVDRSGILSWEELARALVGEMP